MDDSVIKCDEIISVNEVNSIEKNTSCKTQNFYILIAFLLIAITSLIDVSIYCYLTKYWAKHIHLLPFHNKKNLNNIYIDNINWKWVIRLKINT